MSLGPYKANYVNGEYIIAYTGNKVFDPQDNIKNQSFDQKMLDNRVEDLASKKYFAHLHKIDNGIFFACVDYFKSLGAEWCNLPLTTLMISSPGEVYAGKKLDYTTDTLPIRMSWFDNDKEIFLSESSQFYLELRLLTDGVNKVFSIYNSFRKEKADFCHLSEFQHVEFEGKVSLAENIMIAKNLLAFVTEYLVKNNRSDLGFFLEAEDINSLHGSMAPDNFSEMTLKEALSMLHEDTGDGRYAKFSLKNFGSWEEIRITELTGKHVILTQFPMVEIPFYHDAISKDAAKTPLAENADFILEGFRETIGVGQRIKNIKLLKQKTEMFNLPPEDYEPYLQMRELKNYQQTSGLGMGWQRYVQWLLKLPYIWEATHVPRGHLLPKP